MKQMRRKITAWLLAVCLLIGLAPAVSVSAGAEYTPTPTTEVCVGGSYSKNLLTAAKPYLVNGVATAAGAGEPAEWTAYFDAVQSTLTLKNYHGGRIGYINGDLTIKVIGENIIEAPDNMGITIIKHALTIQGEGKNSDSSLTVISGNSSINGYNAPVTIKDLASLDLTYSSARNSAIYNREGSITISNIGNLRIKALNNTSVQSAIRNYLAPIKVENVSHIEMQCAGSAFYADGGSGIEIKNCGTISIVTKSGEALETYNAPLSVQNVGSLLVSSEYYNAPIRAKGELSITGVTSLIVNAPNASYGILGDKGVTIGGAGADEVKMIHIVAKNKAIYTYSGSTITVNGDEPTETEKGKIEAGTVPTTKNATLTVSIQNAVDDKVSYAGRPVNVSISEIKNSEDEVITPSLTYVYVWSKDGNTLASAPTDVGTGYSVTVYGVNDNYYALGQTEFSIVTSDVPVSYQRTVSGTVHDGVANVSAKLPEIPSGMRYGTPEYDSGKLKNVYINGDKLYYSADSLGGASTIPVTIPVSGSSNYHDYNIVVTLTNTTEVKFDLCDGINVIQKSTGAPTDEEITASKPWANSVLAEKMHYTLEGWYTAPNGWGNKVVTFAPGQTYYAHWTHDVYTIGDDTEPLKLDTNVRKTVYTEPLNFEYDNMPVSDGSYAWDTASKTLSIDQLVVDVNDNVYGIYLPAGTTVTQAAASALYSIVSVQNEGSYAYGLMSGGKLTLGAADGGRAALFIYGGVLTGDGGDLTINDTVIADTISSGGDLNLNNTLYTQIPAGTTGLDLDKVSIQFDGDVFADGALNISKNVALWADMIGASNINMSSGKVTAYNGLFTDALTLSGGSMSVGVAERPSGSSSFGRSFLSVDGALTVSGGELTAMSIVTKEMTVSDGEVTVKPAETDAAARESAEQRIDAFSSAINATELAVSGGSLTVYGNGAYGISAGKMTFSGGTTTVDRADGNDMAFMALDALVDESGAETIVLNGTYVKEPAGGAVGTVEGSRTICNPDGTAAYPVTIAKYTPSSSSSSGSSPTYSVTPAASENGTVTVTPKNAAKGSTVTVNVKPDEGYVLDTLTVTDQNGAAVAVTEKDGKYVFTMPAGKVDIKAVFKPEAPVQPVIDGKAAYDSFSDLGANAWYRDAVEFMLSSGLMQGVGDGKFDPNGETTRGMIVSMLWRLAGSPQTGENNDFTDVSAGKWYTDAVAWATANGITSGYGDGTFGPNDTITREQLAAMLYRFVQQQGGGFTGTWAFPLDFSDASQVSGWAYEPLCWLTMNGVISGMGDGTIAPAENATRAQTASMLMRFCESVK